MSFKNRVAPEHPASAPAPSPLAIVEALQTSDSSASAADTAVDPDDDEEELAIPKRFTLGGASRSQSRRTSAVGQLASSFRRRSVTKAPTLDGVVRREDAAEDSGSFRRRPSQLLPRRRPSQLAVAVGGDAPSRGPSRRFSLTRMGSNGADDQPGLLRQLSSRRHSTHNAGRRRFSITSLLGLGGGDAASKYDAGDDEAAQNVVTVGEDSLPEMEPQKMKRRTSLSALAFRRASISRAPPPDADAPQAAPPARRRSILAGLFASSREADGHRAAADAAAAEAAAKPALTVQTGEDSLRLSGSGGGSGSASPSKLSYHAI